MTLRIEIVNAVVAWRDARDSGDKHRARIAQNAIIALFEHNETQLDAMETRGKPDMLAGAVVDIGRAQRSARAATAAFGCAVGDGRADGFVVALDRFEYARDHIRDCWTELDKLAQNLRPQPPARRVERLAA